MSDKQTLTEEPKALLMFFFQDVKNVLMFVSFIYALKTYKRDVLQNIFKIEASSTKKSLTTFMQ